MSIKPPFLWFLLVTCSLIGLTPAVWTAEPGHWGRRQTVTLAALQAGFAQPDPIYAPFMFWFWDEPLDPNKIARMAREMVTRGFNPGYTHGRMNMAGRPDLPREQWLSPVWFDAFERALTEAGKAGAYVGYVDDYWWPSFRAADRVLQENPDFHARSLQCHAIDCESGKPVEIGPSFFTVAARVEAIGPAPAEPPVRNEPGKPPEPQSINRPQPHPPAVIQFQSLRLIGSGDTFTWTPPDAGPWRVYRFTEYYHPGADGGRLNYLDDRLAPAFLRQAHEPYARRFGERMGRSIPGAFVDHEGSWGYKMAWSASLDRAYRERYSRDIRLWMPLLLDEDDEGVFARARWEWFEVVSDLYAQTLGAVSRWLEERGLYCISNLWEETLMWQAAAVGDFFKAQRAYSLPGTDCLALNALGPHDFMETRSVTDFEGRRFMSEIMGAAGFWGFSPNTIKQVANAITTWGVSHVVAHGVFLTRKLDGNPWLPDWFEQNPFWPWMNQWTDFVRRASYINSHGTIAADVLLVSPMDSVWVLAGPGLFDPARPDRVPVPAVMEIPDRSIAEFPLEALKHQSAWWCPPRMDDWFGKKVHHINKVYGQAMNDLTSGRIEYLVADRHYLGRMTIQKGALVDRAHTFRTVVLPPMVVLPLAMAEKIVAFARHGGKVYSLGELPSGSTERGWKDERMTELMKELAGLPSFRSCPEGLKPIIEERGEGLSSPVQFEAGGFAMLMQRRQIDGCDFYWLANNTGQAQSSILRLRGHGGVTQWDCETGAIRPVEARTGPAGLTVPMRFGPYEGFWLVVDPKTAPTRTPEATAPKEAGSAVGLAGPWTVRIDPTIQPAMEHPFDLATWGAETTQANLEDWSQWGLVRFSGLVDYETTFTLPPAPGSCVLDLGKVRHAAEVWVNGQSCGRRLWPDFTFDLSAAAKPGENRLSIRVGNLINNSYGQSAESGLFGPVTLRWVEGVASAKSR